MIRPILSIFVEYQYTTIVRFKNSGLFLLKMQEILQQIGYLKSEASVYAALLELGQSTAGIIAKKSNLNRVSVYKALDKLIKDGLASYTIQANRKTFKAANPAKIKDILEERKNQILDFEKQIPSIIQQYKDKKEKVQSDIYEGIKGLKTLAERFLKESKPNDEWLVLGAPKKAEILGGYYQDLNERRAKKDVMLKIVYNKDAKSLYETRKKQPLTEVRIMQENLITPSSIEVLGDKVAIILYSPTIICFSIENQKVADSFKQYFDLIWKNSKKL